jgi:hypothetical protein
VRDRVKIIGHKARDIKSGETVLDRSTRFIIKEVRAERGLIAFIDTEGVRHGFYHPEEYLGAGVNAVQITREEIKRR